MKKTFLIILKIKIVIYLITTIAMNKLDSTIIRTIETNPYNSKPEAPFIPSK